MNHLFCTLIIFLDLTRSTGILNSYGILVIMPFTLIALITILLHKMSKHEAKVAIKDSFCQISGAAIALLFGVAMVNLYRYTSNAN